MQHLLQEFFYVAVLELLDDICLKLRFCLDSWQMLRGFYFARHFNSQHGEMEIPELASSVLTLYGPLVAMWCSHWTQATSPHSLCPPAIPIKFRWDRGESVRPCDSLLCLSWRCSSGFNGFFQVDYNNRNKLLISFILRTGQIWTNLQNGSKYEPCTITPLGSHLVNIII